MKLVSVSQMQSIEREANSVGLSYEQMMINAGIGIAQVIDELYQKYKPAKIIGLIGSGNNGGDTLVSLKWLQKHGWEVTAYLVRPRKPNDHLIIELCNAGGEIFSAENDKDFNQLRKIVKQSRILLDGILGTGFHLPLKNDIGDTLRVINDELINRKDEIFIVAIDCPSGVNCDTGETAEETLRANVTVTLAAYKQGFFKNPAYNFLGELLLVDIGLPGKGKDLQSWREIKRFVPDDSFIKQCLPDRPIDAHKGTFGTSLIIAGSKRYTGAALLAGEAAYRIGSGLVTLAVPESIHLYLVGYLPEVTWLPLPASEGFISPEANKFIEQNIDHISSILIGPGLGISPHTELFISDFLQSLQDTSLRKKGCVVDADGLKLLTKKQDWFKYLPPLSILTPHPGEMSILTGLPINEIQANRSEIALYYSKLWGHIVILKGAYTVIASPEEELALIPVATPSLARAGSGDVLAGFTVGLLAQGVDAFKAAIASAFIHAKAGLKATETIGNSASVLARDILVESVSILNKIYKIRQDPN